MFYVLKEIAPNGEQVLVGGPFAELPEAQASLDAVVLEEGLHAFIEQRIDGAARIVADRSS